jgi:hypothetical protein
MQQAYFGLEFVVDVQMGFWVCYRNTTQKDGWIDGWWMVLQSFNLEITCKNIMKPLNPNPNLFLRYLFFSKISN